MGLKGVYDERDNEDRADDEFTADPTQQVVADVLADYF
jgi:hypothetical protein